MANKMLTTAEVIEMMKVSKPTLDKITKEGGLNFVKVGKRNMYFENEVNAYGKEVVKVEETETQIEKVEPKNEVARLPTLDELLQDTHDLSILASQEKQKQLSILLNQEPPASWLKLHPIVKKKGLPTQYLPIERVEYLLTRIFGRWWVELPYPPQLIANSVQITVRLFVVNPITLEVEHQDGVGAVAIQTNANANAIDLTQLKSNGVMLATPMAKTYAIKDAAENFGKIFGKDLNRDEVINYETIIKPKTEAGKPKQEEIQKDRILQMIEFANDIETLDKISGVVSDSFDDELIEAYNLREQEISENE